MVTQQNLQTTSEKSRQQNLFMQNFTSFLEKEGKGVATISTYQTDIEQYFKWLLSSLGTDTYKLYRQNILDFKSFLTVLKHTNSRTINKKLSALKKYNLFLVEIGEQSDVVISKKDFMKIQHQIANPTNATENDVKSFLQKILENENSRDFALVILLAYTGLRISEALNIKLEDFNLQTQECIIRNGKGNKQRTVVFNSKVINSIQEYLRDRESYQESKDSTYLFLSRKSKSLNRTAVNKFFKKYSEKITPHQLRHYFCTNAIEKGMLIHEVANLAGHSNVATTMLYTNPDKEKIKGKLEAL